ncbi:cobalamin biosynthesis protein [Williamsia herbipolensis]|uniref:Cobalamin biosynthesis protein CobD n=1 Tax=Williamsia herbipolensis TaxID=1603258 RepID=A0AAU4K508_9NOCA|nr:cobalamin biosynthesis protein [Williamsia herbipolensis]
MINPPSARRVARALGLVAGLGVDLVFADPRRGHPVAGMGTLAGRLERVVYRDNRWAGVVFVGGCLVSVLTIAEPLRRVGGAGAAAATAAATWTVLGGTGLTRVATAVADALDAGDEQAARALIPSLCGRDPESLDRAGMVRATVESVAENTSDATVAPLVWGAVGGVRGLIAYRMINTLDAMVGHRTPRYEQFGWAAARLDDVANLVPARLAGVIVIAIGGRPADAAAAWRRDARAHPSPNAGVVESSFAGALGIGLGGTTVYRHRVEERPRLGDGPAPDVADLRRAITLSRRVQLVSAVLASAASTVGVRPRRRGN